MPLFDVFKKKEDIKEEVKTAEKKEETLVNVEKKPKIVKDFGPTSIYKVHDISSFNKFYEKYGVQPKTDHLLTKGFLTDYEIFHDGTLKENLELADLIISKGYKPFKKVSKDKASHMSFTQCIGNADIETIKYFNDKGLLNDKDKLLQSFMYSYRYSKEEYSKENISKYIDMLKYMYEHKMISFINEDKDNKILGLFGIHEARYDLRIISAVYSFVSEEEKKEIKKTYFNCPYSQFVEGIDEVRLSDFVTRHNVTKEFIDSKHEKFVEKLLSDFSDISKYKTYTKENPYVLDDDYIFIGNCTVGNVGTYLTFGDSVKFVFSTGNKWDMQFYQDKKYYFEELVLNHYRDKYFWFLKKLIFDTVHIFGPKDNVPKEFGHNEAVINNIIYHSTSKTEWLKDAKTNMVFMPGTIMEGYVKSKNVFVSKDVILKTKDFRFIVDDVYTDAENEHDGSVSEFLMKNSKRVSGSIAIDMFKIHYGYTLDKFCTEKNIIVIDEEKLSNFNVKNSKEEPIKNVETKEIKDETNSNKEELIKQYNNAVDEFVNVLSNYQKDIEETVKKEKEINKVDSNTQNMNTTKESLKKKEEQVKVMEQDVIDNDAIVAEFEDEEPNAIYTKYRGSDIKSIIIPENTSELLEAAFGNCKNLKTVYFNAKKCKVVRWWESDASTEIPTTINSVFGRADGNTLQYIEVFGDKNDNDSGAPYWVEKSYLENFIIGDKVEKLDANLIRYTTVKKLHIPASVKNIDQKFFYGTKIEEITVDPKNKYFELKDNMFIEKDKGTLLYILKGITVDKNFIVPEYIKKITRYSFYGHSEINSVECSSDCEVNNPLKAEGFPSRLVVNKKKPKQSVSNRSNKYPSLFICDGDTLVACDMDELVVCDNFGTLEIPEGITEVADNALDETGENIVRFPKTCKKIGKSVFGERNDYLKVVHFDNENTIVPKSFRNYSPKHLKFYTFGTGDNIKKIYFARWVQHTLINFEPNGTYTIDLDYYVKTEKTKYQAFLLSYCACRYFGYKDDSGIKDNISSGLLKALEEGFCENEIIIGNEDIDWLISNGYLSDQKLIDKAREVIADNESQIDD